MVHHSPKEFLIWHCTSSLFEPDGIGPKSFLIWHCTSSLFEPDGAVNYDYIVTNSINSSLIGSRCIPNGAHTNHC